MTKRCELNEVPYKNIQVGEKVMYLSRSSGYTSMDFGFYRGMNGFTPVVEKFYRERKWHLDKERDRYVQDDHWSTVSRRVHLHLGRLFSNKRINEMISRTPDCIDIELLSKRDEESEPG